VALDEPLELYEQFYREYFCAYCDSELAETEAERQAAAPLAALRPLLKYRLADARQAILAMPHQPDREWREVQIRKPNGDTQRMRTIFGAN
jgi:DNA-directed RNA polymerase subunit RPC12/RpoP